MYGNSNSSNSNNNGGYPPYGYSNKSSGGRLFGMSHSLPSGMDTEFTSAYPSSSSRRGYSDMTGGGVGVGSGGNGSANSLTGGTVAAGTVCNVPPTASNNSLNCLGPGIGNNGGGGSAGSNSGGSTGGGDDCEHIGTNLIVNYLPQDMTDRELYALFRTVGPINTCRIMRDYKTGYSFGYAFVDYTTEMDSQRAIKTLSGITVRNKRLKVSYARPGGEAIKDTNLYVTNLPRTITEDKLDTIFGKYGSIVQKNILRDKLTGKPRGVAFVRFNKREEAQEAIANLHNIIPEGGSQSLCVRLAEEHGKAKAAHFMTQMGMGPLGPPQPPSANFHMNAPGGSANMMTGMVHRGENFTELLDGLYRKKALQFQY